MDWHRTDHRQKRAAGPGVARKSAARTPASGGILALQAAAGNRAIASLVRQHAGRYPAVQRDLKTVETELKKRFNDPDDPRLLVRMAALGDQIGRLNEKDSAELVMQLFQALGNNVFTDRFQTLSAGPRYELLSALFGRLGHVGAEVLTDPLTSGTDPLGYQARFRQLVPDPQRRRKLLSVLSGQFAAAHKQAPANRKLWVNWDDSNFRTSGGFSADNEAQQAALKNGFSQLGVQPDPRSGNNVMELRGDVVGHAADTTYDIKQTVEMRSWKLIDKDWIEDGVKSGDDDTQGNSDEDLTPDEAHPHVYLNDGPGVPRNMAFDPHAGGYAYRATFVTWVIAKTPGSGKWERVSDDFEWHSSSTMKKINGKWVRDRAGLNEIDVGPQPIMAPDF